MNKIGWCTDTRNPLSGCTNFATQHCGDYCYAARMAKRLAGRFGYPKEEPFKPTFHEDVLQKIGQLPGKGKRVFLNSMGDWFCDDMPTEWVHRVLDVIDQVPQHHFLVLTKRPERIMDVLHCRNLPPNLWLGVSVTCRADLWRISMLKESIPSSTKRFVSFEPLLGPVYCAGQKLGGLDWVIVGRESGNQKGRAPIQKLWIDNICEAVNPRHIPVYLKGGMCGPRCDGAYVRREEFPEEMRQ